jgi:dinuclear metal center YbgI/SA1388 family protein
VDPKVSDIIDVLDGLAPRSLAEEWDNVGLQVGNPGRTVKNIWIALDPTDAVVKAACRQKIDLLVTHHPLLFKPLKTLDLSTPAGSVIDHAVRHQLAIFAAHTNLDSALGGINDILAGRIGLYDLKPLTASRERQRFKMVIYAPREVEQPITRQLFLTQSDIGPRIMGRFCEMPVNGIVANRDNAKISYEDQIRIEIEVGPDELETVVNTLAVFQPGNQIWYDIYPLITPDHRTGIGRVGSLESALDLKSLALVIKRKLKLKHLKFTGNPALSVDKVAVCSGSGASLLSNFFASGAQVFVSGDLRYHDARDVEASNLGLIDIGHFASEHLIVKEMTERLSGLLAEFQMNATVKACDIETDPFTAL